MSDFDWSGFDFAALLAPFEFVPRATQDSETIRQFGFLPGLKELLMVRQVHALEHATVWVLSELEQGYSALNPAPAGFPAAAQAPSGLLGGMSTERGFYLYGSVDPGALRQAVHLALRRLVGGEWALAVHPHCGTNLSTGLLLTTGLAAGFSLVAPKDPLGQLLGFGAAATMGSCLAPDLGSLAQRYLTTAIPFNLSIEGIEAGRDRLNRDFHFVTVCWVD